LRGPKTDQEMTEGPTGHIQSAHAECVPNSPLVLEPPLVSKVLVSVLKTARALTRPRGFESHTLR